MNEYLLLKFLHLLAFVYWLGGDLGTFLSSRYVVRDDLSPEARATALKIMLACDQGPKSAMPVILPLGLQMSQMTGLTTLPAWVMVVVWLLALLWAGIVQYLFFTTNLVLKPRVAQFDFGLRIAVVLALLVYAGGALAGTGWIGATWLALKSLIFAAMVVCGLLIRVKLKPFVAAFGQLMSSGPSDQVNAAMRNALGRVRPWVWLIWTGLFINAALGLHLLPI